MNCAKCHISVRHSTAIEQYIPVSLIEILFFLQILNEKKTYKMGVPYLFQAIAERYPCLMANITANQVI